MDVENIIKDIEDKNIKIDKRWFYHGSPFTYEKYYTILREGILAKNTRGTNSSKYNYIYINRKEDDSYASNFSNYVVYPRIILNNKIKAIGVNDSYIKKLLNHASRDIKLKTMHSDEYQVYKKIPPKKIIGIAFDIEYLMKKYPENTDIYLNILRELSFLLTEEFDLPLIDVLNKKEINKNKVLSLTR